MSTYLNYFPHLISFAILSLITLNPGFSQNVKQYTDGSRRVVLVDDIRKIRTNDKYSRLLIHCEPALTETQSEKINKFIDDHDKKKKELEIKSAEKSEEYNKLSALAEVNPNKCSKKLKELEKLNLKKEQLTIDLDRKITEVLNEEQKKYLKKH